MPDSQPVPEQPSRKPEIADFVQNSPKKTELLEKFKLPYMRGFQLMEMRRDDSCAPANPIHNLCVLSMV